MTRRTLRFRKIVTGLIAAITVAAVLPVDAASAASFKLTVQKAGSGSGNVTSFPAGISCGKTCSVNLSEGTLVSLTATPSPGHRFVKWEGACLGSGSCIVEMTSAKTVTATFVADPRALTVSRLGVGSGSVTSRPSGINCGTACSKNFPVGTSVTLTATAATGSFFAGWGGACSGLAVTCTVPMTSDRSVTATFQLRPVLTISKPGDGTGTVTSNIGGISCGKGCRATYTTGATVVLTATPSSTSLFTGWDGGDGCSTERTCTVKMDGPRTVSAYFEPAAILTVRKAGTGTGKVTSDVGEVDCGTKCSATLPVDTFVTLTAVPSPGHIFDGWTGACTNTDAECEVTLTAARLVTANFRQVPYQLEIDKDGSGSGTIISNLIGIDCGTRCLASVPAGVSLTLTAVPASGSAFTGWSGIDGCEGVGPCTILMTEDTTVTASFEPGYLLRVLMDGDGRGTVTSNPEGLDCGPPCSASFVQDTEVELTPDPAANYEFVGWSGPCTVVGDSCFVTMDQARSVTAAFARIRHNVSVTVDGSGTVKSNVVGIDCRDVCDADFDQGSSIRLVATPDVDSIFVGWQGSCTGTRLVCSLSIDDVKDVLAIFDPTYALTVTKLGDGAGTVSWSLGGLDCGTPCTRRYTFNTMVTLTATPASGSVLRSWGLDCAEETGTTCTLTMDDIKDVTVEFGLPYTLTVLKSGVGSGTVVSSDGINCGSVCSAKFPNSKLVTLTAVPASGNILAGWSESECGTNAVCVVEVDQTKTVTVRFAPVVTLTVSTTGGTGSGSVWVTGENWLEAYECTGSCSVQVARDSVVTLVAEAAAGSRFKEWSGRCTGTIPQCSVTMSLSRSVTAVFEPA